MPSAGPPRAFSATARPRPCDGARAAIAAAGPRTCTSLRVRRPVPPRAAARPSSPGPARASAPRPAPPPVPGVRRPRRRGRAGPCSAASLWRRVDRGLCRGDLLRQRRLERRERRDRLVELELGRVDRGRIWRARGLRGGEVALRDGDGVLGRGDVLGQGRRGRLLQDREVGLGLPDLGLGGADVGRRAGASPGRGASARRSRARRASASARRRAAGVPPCSAWRSACARRTSARAAATSAACVRPIACDEVRAGRAD